MLEKKTNSIKNLFIVAQICRKPRQIFSLEFWFSSGVRKAKKKKDMFIQKKEEEQLTKKCSSTLCSNPQNTENEHHLYRWKL